MSVGWFTSISALLLDRYYMYVLGAAGHPNGPWTHQPEEVAGMGVPDSTMPAQDRVRSDQAMATQCSG